MSVCWRGRKGQKETLSHPVKPGVYLFRSSRCYWLSAILYFIIGLSFMATVKRLCDYKEENFRLMQELAVERQKEGLSPL